MANDAEPYDVEANLASSAARLDLPQKISAVY
jgi:hypothetical protein